MVKIYTTRVSKKKKKGKTYTGSRRHIDGAKYIRKLKTIKREQINVAFKGAPLSVLLFRPQQS